MCTQIKNTLLTVSIDSDAIRIEWILLQEDWLKVDDDEFWRNKERKHYLRWTEEGLNKYVHLEISTSPSKTRLTEGPALDVNPVLFFIPATCLLTSTLKNLKLFQRPESFQTFSSPRCNKNRLNPCKSVPKEIHTHLLLFDMEEQNSDLCVHRIKWWSRLTEKHELSHHQYGFHQG